MGKSKSNPVWEVCRKREAGFRPEGYPWPNVEPRGMKNLYRRPIIFGWYGSVPTVQPSLKNGSEKSCNILIMRKNKKTDESGFGPKSLKPEESI